MTRATLTFAWAWHGLGGLMKLACSLLHMRNASVSVDGVLVHVDEHGVASNVSDVAAKTLCASSAWRVIDAQRVAPVVEPVATVVEPVAPVAPVEPVAAVVEPVAAPVAVVEPVAVESVAPVAAPVVENRRTRR